MLNENKNEVSNNAKNNKGIQHTLVAILVLLSMVGVYSGATYLAKANTVSLEGLHPDAINALKMKDMVSKDSNVYKYAMSLAEEKGHIKLNHIEETSTEPINNKVENVSQSKVEETKTSTAVESQPINVPVEESEGNV